MLSRWFERCGSLAGNLWRRATGAFGRAPREVLDPDIREVFLAELDELSETLASLLTDLQANPNDPAILQNLRRAFHTIKGSGLMAGALSLAGVCGRLERLAVQLVERRMNATPDVLSLFGQAIQLLPECRRSIEAGTSMPAAMAVVGLRVKRLLGEG
jgi:chemosensory pili system protein ChpA (sensor histidine kinase/response regulator)